ncbi:MAG: hypothetical protein P4L74_06575 [Candidatus Doudnabacteria bacterium]|nr:hypothetical protein [Candidatus Doudnabacteria bacterium]
MQTQTVIEQLGYSKSQAKIYLASLRLGEAIVSEIAERVAMPRTTVEELILGMNKQGLMNYYVKRGRKYWVAEKPGRLLEILKGRESAFVEILPQLEQLGKKNGNKPSVHYYSGFEEIKNIFDDIIETKHHVKALLCWEDLQENMGRQFMSDFAERRCKHFLKIQVISPNTRAAAAMKARDTEESRQTRFLPADVPLQNISNFIYGAKVAIISFNRRKSTGVVIEDPVVARAQTIYFDNLWQHSGIN